MSTQRSELGDSSPENQVEFGQKEVAEFVLKEIDRDPNIQIAINGPWGSGKTTILDKAYSELQEDSSTIAVWYEPWRYSPDQTTLRRTFLKAVYENASTEIEDVEPITEDEFHFDQINEETRSVSGFITELYGTIKNQFKFIIPILAIIGLLLLVQLLFTIFNSGITSSIIALFAQLAAFTIVVSLGFYLRNDLVAKLSEDLTYDVREPKISEIDLFEDKYEEMIAKIGRSDKNLVVFIDDLDRCNKDEMREVITALSTYLDPDNDQAPVSFVTAIDGPKIVDSFDGDTSEDDTQLKPNILNKTFQIVIPVPSLSRSNVSKLIQITAEDLDHQMAREDITNITRIAVSHANSNLRIIRSALSDLVWMKELGESYITDREFSDSESFREIMNNDYVLFRISLIKLLSRNEDLRSFVTDASMWVDENNRSGDILWDLFDIPPSFEPSGIDPRPLLALNNPNQYPSNIQNFSEINKEITGGRNPGNPMPLIEEYGPAAQVDIAYRFLDSNIEDEDRDVKSAYVSTIIGITYNSIDAIDERNEDLFNDCLQIVKGDRKIVSNINNKDYPKWVSVGNKVGGVEKLFDKSSPFMKQDKTRFLKQVSNSISDFDMYVIELLIDVEIDEAENGNEVSSAKRMSTIFNQDSSTGAENAPDYLLKLLRNWSFDDNPSGPTDKVLHSDVVSRLKSEEYIDEAEKVFLNVGSHGDVSRDYLDTLLEKGWPRPTDFGQDSE